MIMKILVGIALVLSIAAGTITEVGGIYWSLSQDELWKAVAVFVGWIILWCGWIFLCAECLWYLLTGSWM